MYLKQREDQRLTEGAALDLLRTVRRYCWHADIYLAERTDGKPASEWRFYVAHNSASPKSAARAEHAADQWHANRLAMQRAGQPQRHVVDVVARL